MIGAAAIHLAYESGVADAVRTMLTACGWEAAPEDLSLAEGDVHLWAWPLGATGEEQGKLRSLLAEDEQQRMTSFYFDRDQLSYLVARGTLRRVLGVYLSKSPETVRFQYSEHGKPSLAPGEGRLDFNLSHTQGLAVAAFSSSLRVGVDIEEKRSIPQNVAADLFSAEEHLQHWALAAEQKLDGFYNCWVRKEAIAKAEGLGLSMAMAEFSVSLAPGAAASVLTAGTILSRKWMLFDVAVGMDMAGALAVSAQPRSVRRLCFR